MGFTVGGIGLNSETSVAKWEFVAKEGVGSVGGKLPKGNIADKGISG